MNDELLKWLGGGTIGAVIVAVLTKLFNRKNDLAVRKKTEAEREAIGIDILDDSISIADRIVKTVRAELEERDKTIAKQNVRIEGLESGMESLKKKLIDSENHREKCERDLMLLQAEYGELTGRVSEMEKANA